MSSPSVPYDLTEEGAGEERERGLEGRPRPRPRGVDLDTNEGAILDDANEGAARPPNDRRCVKRAGVASFFSDSRSMLLNPCQIPAPLRRDGMLKPARRERTTSEPKSELHGVSGHRIVTDDRNLIDGQARDIRPLHRARCGSVRLMRPYSVDMR